MSEPKREQLFVMSKASINLNQIAHQVNRAHLEGTVSEKLYLETLASLEMIQRYLKATL